MKRWTKVEVVQDVWPNGLVGQRRSVTAANLHCIHQGVARFAWAEQHIDVRAGQLVWVPAGMASQRSCHRGAVERTTLHLRSGAWAPGNEADSEALTLIKRLDRLAYGYGLRLPCTRATVEAIVADLHEMAALWNAPESRYHRIGLKAGAVRILTRLDADRRLQPLALADEHHSDQDAVSRIEPALYHLNQRNYIIQPELTVADLSRLCGYRPSRFHALFVEATGVTPLRYLTERRVALACDLLDHNDDRIIDIALACGFNSQSRFYHAFTAIVGQSPARWRRRQSERA